MVGAQLLDMEEIDPVSGPDWRGILLLHNSSRTIIEVQQHGSNRGETFDPSRTGFDHLGSQVDQRTDLDDWVVRFAELGVTYTPIAVR